MMNSVLFHLGPFRSASYTFFMSRSPSSTDATGCWWFARPYDLKWWLWCWCALAMRGSMKVNAGSVPASAFAQNSGISRILGLLELRRSTDEKIAHAKESS